MAKKREHFIIDGYNVIHALPELAALAGDLAEARDRLIHLLMECSCTVRKQATENKR